MDGQPPLSKAGRLDVERLGRAAAARGVNPGKILHSGLLRAEQTAVLGERTALTLEDLRWDAGDGPSRGRLATPSASTYKLPSFSEMPEVFNVALLEAPFEDAALHGSKAVGEPPLMLAFSVREALRQAAAAFGPEGVSVDLASPATPEAVWWALEGARRHPAEHHVVKGTPGVVPDQPDASERARPIRPHSEIKAGSRGKGG